MKKTCLLTTLALSAAFFLNACGGASGPDADLADYIDSVKGRLPQGWTIARGRELPFKALPPTADDSLVIYKTAPVALEAERASTIIDATGSNADTTTTQKSRDGHIYFTLARHDYVEPEKFAEQFKNNEKIRREHARVLAKIANVPKDEKGNPVPRGSAESVEVAAVLKEYKALPPYVEHMPTHYYGNVAFKMHDYRVQLVPLDRDLQQEQNKVYALLVERLKRYPTR